MRPTKLIIDGFLSYRQAEAIDFSIFDVACVTGENGAGKSSILDAITFALYGEARVKDTTDLINLGRDEAQVTFEFTYSGTDYRIVRTIYKKTTKPMTVDFSNFNPSSGKYELLNETTRTKTDKKIEQILKLDLDTFKATSFFLQGQADFFATSDRNKRKEILGKILQLEKWDTYHSKVKDRKRNAQSDLQTERNLQGRLTDDIKPEAETKEAIKKHQDELKALLKEIDELNSSITVVAKLLSNIEDLKRDIERDTEKLKAKAASINDKQTVLDEKNQKLQSINELIANADQINAEALELQRQQKTLKEQNELKGSLETLTTKKQAVSEKIELLNQQLDEKISQLKNKENKINEQVSSLVGLEEQKGLLLQRSERSTKLGTELKNLEETKNKFTILSAKFDKWAIINAELRADKKEHQQKLEKLIDAKDKFISVQKQIAKLTADQKNNDANLKSIKLKQNKIIEINKTIDQLSNEKNLFENKKAETNERLEHVTAIHSPNCPTCEQILTEQDREKLIAKLTTEISNIDNKINKLSDEINDLERSIKDTLADQVDVKALEKAIRSIEDRVLQIKTTIDQFEVQLSQWNDDKQTELDELSKTDGADPKQVTELEDLSDQINNLSKELQIISNNSGVEDAKKLISDRIKAINEDVTSKNRELKELESIPAQIAVLDQNVLTIQKAQEGWNKEDAPELSKLTDQRMNGTHITAELSDLKQIQDEIDVNGYDEQVRSDSENFIQQNEKSIQDRQNALANAPSARTDLVKDINSIQKDNDTLAEEQKNLSAQIEDRQQKIGDEAELNERKIGLDQELMVLRQKETDLNQNIGSANTTLLSIEQKKKDLVEVNNNIEKLNYKIINLEILEKAFGKKGIPNLLIEQAKPDIEKEANQILARLTDGFSITIDTQKDYRDKNRQDLQETLDISISDGSGTRSYESYSGGEAFRVNFALRMALSKMLVHRADAKLELLVIDEGFGSQDDIGKQKLIEAIKTVQPEYAKILVITHMDDLKERFDHRIEVEKFRHGSRINVT